MSWAKDWERFYTDSKTGDDDLVDQIEINAETKSFYLYIDESYLITDGYDDEDEPIVSEYVSRFAFDLIVKGIRERGFTELEYEE